jgi:hypothetical protein
MAWNWNTTFGSYCIYDPKMRRGRYAYGGFGHALTFIPMLGQISLFWAICHIRIFVIILWIKILHFYFKKNLDILTEYQNFHIFQSDPDISVLGYPSFIY